RRIRMTTTPILNGPTAALGHPPEDSFPSAKGCLREGANQSARCSGREQRLAPSMDTGSGGCKRIVVRERLIHHIWWRGTPAKAASQAGRKLRRRNIFCAHFITV